MLLLFDLMSKMRELRLKMREWVNLADGATLS